jgi:hypothetical protein
MRSLALDVNVVSEEGARAEMRDEDDDLLRAAEELGIDLSGVVANHSPPEGTRILPQIGCGAFAGRAASGRASAERDPSDVGSLGDAG